MKTLEELQAVRETYHKQLNLRREDHTRTPRDRRHGYLWDCKRGKTGSDDIFRSGPGTKPD